MNVTAWPFLISRNRYLDYRTLVAPDFLCKANISNLLARVADGELTDAGFAYFRQIYGTKAGDFSVVFQVEVARQREANTEKNEARGQSKQTALKDQFGREIYFIYGAVVQSTDSVSISQSVLDTAKAFVIDTFDGFWSAVEPCPAVPSPSMAGEVDDSTSLILKVVSPFRQKPAEHQLSSSNHLTAGSSFVDSTKVLFDAPVGSITFSSDSETLFAISSIKPTVWAWNISDCSIQNQRRGRLKVANASDRAIACSPKVCNSTAFNLIKNKNEIAFPGVKTPETNGVNIWNIEKNERVLFFPHNAGPGNRIHSVMFSDDGQLLFSASSDYVNIDDLTNTSLPYRFSGLKGITAMDFLPKTRTLVVGNAKGVIAFLDMTLPSSLGSVSKHEIGRNFEIKSISHSPIAPILAIAGDGDRVDGEHILLWNMMEKDVSHVLDGHNDPVNSVIFSPDGNFIVSGSDDKMVKVWNPITGVEVETLTVGNQSFRKGITSVAFSPDGKFLACGSLDRSLRIWQRRQD